MSAAPTGEMITAQSGPDLDRTTARPSAEDPTVKHHTSWVASCSAGPVTFRQFNELDIYTADPSHTDVEDIVACLLSVSPNADRPETIVGTPEALGLVFRTPFYTRIYPATFLPLAPSPAALIKTSEAVHVVQHNIEVGLHGIVRLAHVRNDIFVVTSQGIGSPHKNYLFFGETGDVRYLRDGDIQIVDADEMIFRVKRAQSFWKPFDFYYDAVVDQYGNIREFEVPTSGFFPPQRIVCTESHFFLSRSTLDLSHLSRTLEVCVVQ